jgi:cobalt-zinc-cadmium efflux system outer membrane protein
MSRKTLFVFSIVLLNGCVTQSPEQNSSYDYSYISSEIKDRTSYELKHVVEDSGQFDFPEWVSLEDGLSQDEAVALALWNNADFHADLASLGFARAELQQANMLSNPVFSILFPVSPKLLETSLELPIDVLWQRPYRVAVAELDAQKLAENLVQNGLELVREVRITYNDLVLTQEKMRLLEEDAQLKTEMAELDKIRSESGEISELVASTSYIDSLQMKDELKELSMQIEILRQQLNNLLGITSSDDIMFVIVPPDNEPICVESVDELIETALVCRPELRAAELAIEVSGQRIGWEKSKIYNFIAVLDGDDTDDDSFTVRPGFSVEIPIFNQNDPAIERARAQLEQSACQYEAVRQKIILEVRQAYTGYVSIEEQINYWNNDVIPSLKKAAHQMQKSYEAGDVSYISVLKAQQKLNNAQIHLSDLSAGLQHSKAELNYCVGTKV